MGHKGVIKGDLGLEFSSPQALDGIHADIALNLKGDAASASLEPFMSGSEQTTDALAKRVAVEPEAFVGEFKAAGIVLEIGESKLDKLYLNKQTY